MTPIMATYKTQDYTTGEITEEEVQIIQFVMVPQIGSLRTSNVHAVYTRKTAWGHSILENRDISEFTIPDTIKKVENEK